MPTIERSVDKSLSRRLPSIMRSTLRRVNGTNAKGPTSKGKSEQVDKVVEYAAHKNTSIHNACEIVARDFQSKDGYGSVGALYGYCHDHEETIRTRILGIKPDWRFRTE